MFENERVVPAVNELNEPLSTLDKKTTPEFPEVKGRTSVFAFLLGMAIILASIALGYSYTFAFAFFIISVFFTFRWRKAPRPWIFLVSTVASTPISPSQIRSLPAVSYLLFGLPFLTQGIYLSFPNGSILVFCLALFGFVVSSIELDRC